MAVTRENGPMTWAVVCFRHWPGSRAGIEDCTEVARAHPAGDQLISSFTQ